MQRAPCTLHGDTIPKFRISVTKVPVGINMFRNLATWLAQVRDILNPPSPHRVLADPDGTLLLLVLARLRCPGRDNLLQRDKTFIIIYLGSGKEIIPLSLVGKMNIPPGLLSHRRIILEFEISEETFVPVKRN